MPRPYAELAAGLNKNEAPAGAVASRFTEEVTAGHFFFLGFFFLLLQPQVLHMAGPPDLGRAPIARRFLRLL